MTALEMEAATLPHSRLRAQATRVASSQCFKERETQMERMPSFNLKGTSNSQESQ